MGSYIVVYLEILFLCFVVAAIMFAKTSRDLGSEREVVAFRWSLIIFMTMMVIDSFTHMQYRGVIHPPVITVTIASATYASLLAVLAIAWFVFAELQINPRLTRERWFRVFAALPGLLSVVLCMTSVKTGLIFRYDEAGVFRRGPYFAIQNVLAYGYFVFTTTHALYTASREQSYARRAQLHRIALFVVAPTIGALLQLLFAGYPFVGPSICISYLAIFVSMQGNMINTDSLTGLNNRKCLERYLGNTIPTVSKEHPLYVYMIDANHFKKINDTWGHVEGDRALILIAQALRKFAEIHRGFIARYGGDEFVAVASAESVEDPAQLERDVNAYLEDVCKTEHSPYRISVSVGHTVSDNPGKKISELLREADEKMYRAKQKAPEQGIMEQW